MHRHYTITATVRPRLQQQQMAEKTTGNLLNTLSRIHHFKQHFFLSMIPSDDKAWGLCWLTSKDLAVPQQQWVTLTCDCSQDDATLRQATWDMIGASVNNKLCVSLSHIKAGHQAVSFLYTYYSTATDDNTEVRHKKSRLKGTVLNVTD